MHVLLSLTNTSALDLWTIAEELGCNVINMHGQLFSYAVERTLSPREVSTK